VFENNLITLVLMGTNWSMRSSEIARPPNLSKHRNIEQTQHFNAHKYQSVIQYVTNNDA
jgi:hypothetical protein